MCFCTHFRHFRQKQSGCKKTKSNESDINSSLDVKRDQAGQIGHTVSNHNYFLLEKHTISADEHIDHHKHAPGETYSTIVEENDYHSINKDPRANAKDDCDDYDYTTNKASTSGGMSHDTVYNKLKLERQGDYDHVKGQVHINSRITNSDYDTTVTSTARSGYGIGDYDHVKKMGAMLKAASGNDYDTTVSLAAYERKKGERGEENNYNHKE
ncbi:hypothetical protein DPMN_076904 [Dreissena polymorpha]|uniref:Uncharacterized protein n=1 Tax=Dreissena polymorpha TaxID=45954 RepID=A0A9D3YPJ0_DREPO|nr:hypothetical protein DPMN_076904 [Dreissena polymorpha]